MLKKFRVYSKKYNVYCDVEACTVEDAHCMAASYNGSAFCLTHDNPITIQEM